MGLEHHRGAHYEDYVGPYYSGEAETMTEMFGRYEISVEAIKMLCDELAHISGRYYRLTEESVITSDGYAWFCTISIWPGDGEVLVAIPYYSDGPDRCVAFYGKFFTDEPTLDLPEMIIEAVRVLLDAAPKILALACI
jgi:hypothetical protein